ncbi:hypothetical protein BSIN_3941 [Burkholderia singularis]|uniref:Uncharacterized protein n=1 Tax=Burkholderia singularis TaxID=1503053 RepID=A0A238H6T6_9BURK|nr:hypothetical protein BSIN_3941 [Burkholderia singularis]
MRGFFHCTAATLAARRLVPGPPGSHKNGAFRCRNAPFLLLPR